MSSSTATDCALVEAPAADRSRPSIDETFRALYPELKRLARHRLARHAPITLLETTALVHEAWMRLAGDSGMPTQEPGLFLAFAARTMRFIAIDHLRARSRQRRGGDAMRVTLNSELLDVQPADDAQVLRIGEALDELQQLDDRLAQIVEMRCFAGLSEQEIATALALSERTVRRQWRRARSLLRAALG